MTFLIEYTTLVYKWQYAMTKRLKELYPEARFVALISSQVPDELFAYIDRKDVHFEEMIDIKKYQTRFIDDNKDIDYGLIHAFEATIPEKSIWRLVAIDRDWGAAWIKTAILPPNYIRGVNNPLNILRMCQHLIKFYERLFDQYHFDVVLPSNGMNNLACAVMERVTKNHNAHYLVPETIRALGYFSFATNKEQNFPHIFPEYDRLLNDPRADIAVGRAMHDEMIEDLKKEEYYDKLTVEEFKNTTKLKYWIRIFLKIGQALVDWVKDSPARKKNTLFKQKSDWATLWGNICYQAMCPYQVMTLMDPKFFSRFDPDVKYVYYPLSSTPEHSTQVKAPMWINQSVIIEALSKSIPSDWVIYVKEHPQNLLCRLREFSFYKELKSYPNVRLIPTDTNFFEIIKKAQLVVNITGTTGWQAIQFNKPVISFGDNFYDVLGLSVRCLGIEDLCFSVQQAVELARSVPLTERQRRMACLLTALRKHSFWVDHPWKVMGDIVASEKDSQEIGKKIADCLRHYLADTGLPQTGEKLANA